MSSTTELAELHNLIGGLRRCMTSLQSRYGDSPTMRRIVLDAERIFNDVELLDIDVRDLDLSLRAEKTTGDKIGIPDTQYDSDFWSDVDDEGVGGYR
jgi:hypothetical protein